MRLLVCGGRDYRDAQTFLRAVRQVDRERGPITCIISGGARGADAMAEAWAKEIGRDLIVFAADWSQGRKAGPLRNARMLSEGKPDVVLAFPGGKGTMNMIRQANDAGILVLMAGLGRGVAQ